MGLILRAFKSLSAASIRDTEGKDKDRASMHYEKTDRYYFNPELREIVNLAIALGKPLVLMGEAGSGGAHGSIRLTGVSHG